MLYVIGFLGVLGVICVGALVTESIKEMNEISKNLNKDKK